MFGVGLHFSLKDLLSVRAIAMPGALGQIAVATLLGMGLAWLLGWSIGAGLVFGLALSVASTVVLLRALQERHLIETERGRIAVGWLIVEDLAMVLALVLLPALAGILKGDRRAPASAALGAADPRARSARSRPSSRSCWSSAGASSPGCCTTSRTPARASCSGWRCSRSRSASPSAPPSCSACRSRSARSSPA